MSSRARRLRTAASAVLWLLIWELADRLIHNGLLLAGPVRTLQALATQVVRPEFWGIVGSSLGRIAAGFFAAVIGGAILAAIAHRQLWFQDLIAPLVAVVKSIPVVSFIVMLLIWFGGQAFTSWLAFLIVIPLVYTSMLAGLDAIPRGQLERARVFRVPALRQFWYLARPAFLPFLTSACKVGVGMSWRAGIMAEVFATTAGSIGKEMFTAKTFLDTPTLFAWTVVVMLLSVLFERLVLLALDGLARPYGSLLGSRA
ncbi:ABC transporter permease subunit [Leucobacter sp. CSA2]|uniref:ABC transporter permease subunit n=1 Tax=Leucobacter edaphi TaxID=2796472 RepID=A0A934QE46_9MICO|nr:ABC transporter permease subunit [Leucobacter edaphi]MBK0421417.1 ABC transporter permease subunit [Leucobacter edaphi]